jgi:hypothetical protein
MEQHEIKLTERQLQLLQSLTDSKKTIQLEFQRVVQREAEILLTICESNGVELVEGVSVKDGKLLVPKKVKEESKKKK